MDYSYVVTLRLRLMAHNQQLKSVIVEWCSVWGEIASQMCDININNGWWWGRVRRRLKHRLVNNEDGWVLDSLRRLTLRWLQDRVGMGDEPYRCYHYTSVTMSSLINSTLCTPMPTPWLCPSLSHLSCVHVWLSPAAPCRQWTLIPCD